MIGWTSLNILSPRKNGLLFQTTSSNAFFLHESISISIKVSLKFVPRSSINNILALVQIMAWRRSGDRPLSESMMVSLLTHICVTRPQRIIVWAHVGDYVRIKLWNSLTYQCPSTQTSKCLLFDEISSIHITVTSQWPQWRLKSPASRLFTEPFIHAQIKENTKAPRHWPLWGEFTGDRWISRTKGQ